MQSPLRHLVAARIEPKTDEAILLDTDYYCAIFDEAGPLASEAIAGSGLGLDHWSGERVLAGILQRSTPENAEHRLAFAITDRRTVLGGYSSISGNFNGKRWSVPHTEVQQVEVKDGLLSSEVVLVTPQGKFHIEIPQATEMLGNFYNTMVAQVAREQRVEPPTPFVETSEADPSGAAGALANLWTPDPIAAGTLFGLQQQLAAGSFTAEEAHDIAVRAVLGHRSRLGGVGMHEGGWVSPMRAQDFGQCLATIFGAPMAQNELQPGMFTLDFQLNPKADYIGPVLKNIERLEGVVLEDMGGWLDKVEGVMDRVDKVTGAVDTALDVVTLNVGGMIGGAIAGAMMKKTPVTQLRVVFKDGLGFCGYQLQIPSGPLAKHDALMAHRLHQALIRMGRLTTARRCQYGWTPGFHELF